MDNKKIATEKFDEIIEKRAMHIVRDRYQDILERDTLTGIYNRRGFYTHTYSFIHDASGRLCFIACVNIDKFKVVNDLFGTFEGDKLLNFMAKKLREYVKGEGTLARLAADNFAMCLPYREGVFEELSGLVNEWLENYPLSLNIIARLGFYNVRDTEIPISIMCDRANLAILEIKGSYDKNYSVYDTELRARILQEQEIINEMKAALDDHQFVVYYQPKFNMESGKYIGAEALVRWIHPEKGIISPGIFIPIFEKNGFISDLDQYVWEKVCQDIQGWLAMGYSVCPISINVSRTELYNREFVLRMSSLVDKYSIPIRYLQLEITETAYTDNPDQIIEIVNELKEAGFTILMDDFGSGYSSLNTLKDVPVDVLKIDLKFLFNMDKNVKASYILKSVVQMAKRLDLLVIAEGVETQQQADFLKSIGCLRAQGYLYAKPMPKQDLEIYLTDSSLVSTTDDDVIEGLINIDDVLAGFHREDEVEWYRSAIVQLGAMMYEYDIEQDVLTLYDMRLSENTRELSRMEIPSYKNTCRKGALMYKEDAMAILELIEGHGTEDCILRIRNIGGRGFRWFRQNGRILRDETGTAKSVVGVLRDISEEMMDEAVMEMLTAFEERGDEARIFKRTLGAINRGCVSDSAGILFVSHEARHESGGIIMEKEGSYRTIRDYQVLEQLCQSVSGLEKNMDGISVLKRTELDSYDSIIKDILFSNGEQTVVIVAAEIKAVGSGIFVLSYSACEKEIKKQDSRQIAELFKSFRNVVSELSVEKKNNESLSLYRAAFTGADIRLWEWNVNTKIMRRSVAVKGDNLGEWIENMPESMIEKGMIYPDHIERVRRCHQQLIEGKDTILMFKKLQADGTYEWIRINYKVIKDNKDKPLTAIGFGEDMNRVYETQRRVREKLRRNQSRLENEQSWFLVDITADAMMDWSESFTRIKKGESYQQTIELMTQNVLLEEYREDFYNSVSRDNIIESFKCGRRCFATHYGYTGIDGKVHHREVDIDLSVDDNNHIWLFAYVQSVDNIYEARKYVKDKQSYDKNLCVLDAAAFYDIVDGIVSKEREKKGALIIVDMDYFTVIKDNFGTEYSEEIVANIVAIIKAQLPVGAFIGRLYSDRFGIYIPEYTEMKQVFSTYNGIQKSIYSAFAVGSESYVLSASIGLSYSEFFDGDSRAMFDDAVREMLLSKNLTRD